MTSDGPRAASSLVGQVDHLLQAQEGEHLEFKEARNQFAFEELLNYCCALANEGGGRIILGISDRRPRRVVGSRAFPQPEQTRRTLLDRLKLRIELQEIQHPAGRVLVFTVPSRPMGVPLHCDGRYWARRGDCLVPMNEGQLRGIFAESGHDFSADACPEANLSHLDPEAIEEFRRRWITKSGSASLASASHEQLLRDAELLVDKGVTHAALILFGTQVALGRFLGQAEVVFEYRSSDQSGPAQERQEHRRGFFAFYDALWSDIAKRNDTQHYQDGLFLLDILTFDERSVREAVLNAVCHRNYQLGGSVFVRQYPRRLVTESPGGLPHGVTVDNILDRQSPRNRRIAEALAKCGLVERSGQGMNLMFERSIRQGKARPSFVGTDDCQVILTLHGEVADPRFVQFLERVGRERMATFSTADFLVLDLVHRERPVPEDLRLNLDRLRELGIVESVGRGRGTRYLLSRRFHVALGSQGVHTRRRGLDREQNKALLLNHLRRDPAGCPISELQQVLPALSRGHIRALLVDLRVAGRIRLTGERRWARWVAVERGGPHGEE